MNIMIVFSVHDGRVLTSRRRDTTLRRTCHAMLSVPKDNSVVGGCGRSGKFNINRSICPSKTNYESSRAKTREFILNSIEEKSQAMEIGLIACD